MDDRSKSGKRFRAKSRLLKKFGVNRISLGVQSWDDELLKLLGREHNAQQAEESFRILREAGFTNINVDLMFGLPGQTIEQWRATLEKTIALQPEHISAYCLTYEEDTEFFLRHARGEFRQDADADAEFFEMTMAILEDAGYEHYEISNYARPGFSQFTTAPTGLAKIIWASARARFQLSVCGAGRMSAIIAATSIAFSPANHRVDPSKI